MFNLRRVPPRQCIATRGARMATVAMLGLAHLRAGAWPLERLRALLSRHLREFELVGLCGGRVDYELRPFLWGELVELALQFQRILEVRLRVRQPLRNTGKV